MGDIVVLDLTMGLSWTFTPIKEGYYAAYAKIEEILQKGHRVGGDVARVRSYVGE